MKQEEYKNRSEQLALEIRQLTLEINRLSNLRLLAALLALIAIGFALWQQTLLLGLISLALISSFIYLIIQFKKRRDSREYKRALRQVYLDRIARFEGHWRDFRDNGRDILDHYKLQSEDRKSEQSKDFLHRYHLAHDLDVLGPDSLFQRINLAFTKRGRRQLADWLVSQTEEGEGILARQQAVRELSQDEDFRSEFSAYIELGRQRETKQLRIQAKQFIELVESEDQAKSWTHKLRPFVYILPILNLLFLLAYFLLPQLAWIGSTSLNLLTLQLAIAILRFYRINDTLKTIEGFNAYSGIYKQMIEAVESETFTSPYLQQLQHVLQTSDGQAASASLAKLEGLGIWTASRQNNIAWLLLNGLVLWDEQCYRRFREWRAQSGQALETWLGVCSEMEALLSLAGSEDCYETAVWPTIETGNGACFANIEMLKHPLINNDSAVANDADLENSTYIITGSNMSGKTTFLRSLGLAVLMAQAGAVIPANSASLSLFTVYSSIRVDDDVASGVSSFYAEILRIRSMVEASQNSDEWPLLILIDEIFRGTNSADRIMGAKSAVERLSQDHSIVLVSTHDFELCELEHNEKVQATNLHFQEYYENNEIFFDYRLRSGRSQTTNARFLLEMAGIMDASTSESRDTNDMLIE